jgi:ATP/maltotriose-dependent transcriptional regulator MalT/DNA-binding SARP family transcriptional activator
MDQIARPALATRLASLLETGHLLLVAGAGWGKTMALEQCLERRGGVTVWVRCSEFDRDPGRLLADLVEALERAVPGAADVLGDRLASATGPVDQARAARELALELERLVVGPLTIVLDDCERLGESAEAWTAVSPLLEMGGPALRLALASRRRPPMRLARQRAAGRLSEVGAGELAFSPTECEQVIRLARGREPAQEEVDAVWSATEGWPLGVGLSAAAPGAGAGVRDGLAEFFDEEILHGLDSELRAALLRSSLAEQIDAEVAAALGLPAGFDEKVREAGVPLSTNGDGVVSHHPLVRELLLARLAADLPPEELRALHARLADALESSGRPAEAVDHWLAADERARAADTVIRIGGALANSSPLTVQGWLERTASNGGAPGLSLLEGRLAAGAARFDDCEEPLREALQGYAAGGDENGAWLARLALVDAYMMAGWFDRVLPLAEGFESSEAWAAPLVALGAVAALGRNGRFGEALAVLGRVTARAAGQVVAPLQQAIQGCYIDFPAGRLNAALAGVLDGIRRLERRDPFGRLVVFLGFAALIRDERGETEEALAAATRAERVTEETLTGEYFGSVARRFKAAVLAREGRLGEAELELERIGSLPPGWFTGDADITRATLAVRRGRHGEALEHARAAIDNGALEGWMGRHRSTTLLLPIVAGAGRREWAEQLVEEALAACPDGASPCRLLALRAWLRDGEGDAEGALADIGAAWAAAGDEADHMMRRERRRLEPLVWSALERGVLSPREVVPAIDAAAPGGGALLRYTEHPVPEVRREALLAAMGSGNPNAPGRAAALEADPDEGVAGTASAALRRLAHDPPPLVIQMLGRFQVRRGAFEIPEDAWERRIAQRLVRFLLVHRDVAVDEDALFEAFWPDRDARQARRSLQVAVSSARAVLDTSGGGQSVLEAAGRSYRLRLGERDVVDVDEFELAAEAALAARGPERAARLEAAARRWGGEPLPEDRYDDWSAAWRERLNDLYGRLLRSLADARAADGDHAAAVDAARRAVELDELDEAAQRLLMQAYARAGRRAYALRQYLACRRALVDGLGVEPSEETAALQRRILAGEPL